MLKNHCYWLARRLRKSLQVKRRALGKNYLGEKKTKDKVKGEKYYRSERSYGSFVRTLQLPADLQADKVKASFKNGVLEARRPKTEATKANEIKVKVD
jgi:HSP20 family protein